VHFAAQDVDDAAMAARRRAEILDGADPGLDGESEAERRRRGDEAVDVVVHGKVHSMGDRVELRQAMATDAAAIRNSRALPMPSGCR
jgi:hypothetical protein